MSIKQDAISFVVNFQDSVSNVYATPTINQAQKHVLFAVRSLSTAKSFLFKK
jgi:hypothetical protein